MKIKLIFSIFLPLIFGWFVMPYVYLATSGDCSSVNFLIRENQQFSTITKTLRYSYIGSSEHYLKTFVIVNEVNNGSKIFHSEGTIITKRNINIDSLTLETTKSFVLNGIQDKNYDKVAIIDPIAQEGFTFRVYIFRIGNKFRITGFKNTPSSICVKPKNM
ncbi:hypothetical protein [Enterobacter bugandensis]|uniref:hypothetical protein n=1 Tax=Enterobacter bugandensis TaxID=881260 RepID=UPI0020030246|nr:hypothetical protein [Enterobacter bugandensis]MCK6898292.1 hypothetical protein [Enterobacter bugandensis]